MLFPRNGGVYSGPRKHFAGASPISNRRAARELVIETYGNASFYWTAPATMTVDVLGYGARGTDEEYQTVQAWTSQVIIFDFHRTDGSRRDTYGASGSGSGATPASYCGPRTDWTVEQNPTYASTQACIYYTDASYSQQYLATTGAASSAFGTTYPGSYGNTPQTPNETTAIQVTEGQQYYISVPFGGLVQIRYYK
jgi:hypothetical protein